jgi:adenine-specific DNA-methyltransferase
MAKPSKPKTPKQVETLKHDEASRKNIPTAEYQSLLESYEQHPMIVAYERRNRDLDPQLVWREKDLQNWTDLIVPAPPLYIQEKVHPKVLIDDLLRRTKESTDGAVGTTADLFADFNGLPSPEARMEFYQHDQNWSNRMILGDSLQVMASLAEREGLKGKVQCIYIDPPYGIKFNSNFQWSTKSRDVKDGAVDNITREPEQVKAFRDTWRDGIHSYLTYLRDRLTVARDLLTESGSIFVQIGDENVHRLRALLDEVFGNENSVALVPFVKTAGLGASGLPIVCDYLLWYARSKAHVKFRSIFSAKEAGERGAEQYTWLDLPDGTRRTANRDEKTGTDAPPPSSRFYRIDNLTSGAYRPNTSIDYLFRQRTFNPGTDKCWKTTSQGLDRLAKSSRLQVAGMTLAYVRFLDDFAAIPVKALWTDTGTGGFGDDKLYVVQTTTKVIARCILSATDPGDLVLDPTCGSGTSAFVSEQWGRRWITIDTSRVALALARARIMGARYPYYFLADSRDGQAKEAEIARTFPSSQPVRGNIRQGFVYERVPHITLSSIANNTEIDVIWDTWQRTLEPLGEQLNATVKQQWQEWEIPREADPKWPGAAKKLHAAWWEARIARQKEIDASIAAKAEFEYLYDKPYSDNRKVRVAGPFTVESLSPHRILGVDENDELVDSLADRRMGYEPRRDFASMILENLRSAGVQQAHKDDKIDFTSLMPWPGRYICAEGRYLEGSGYDAKEKRAGVLIGPEFGTLSRPDLFEAAREAAEAGFDVLIACAFNYDAHASELNKLGRIPVLKARMNADLHMAEDLKNTGKGNLFVIFGEPDIEATTTADGQVQVRIKGVDVFHPSTGEVRSDGPDGIACWFIDTDYNGESFFVRHAYFLGQNDPYGALKTTLKAEVNEEAWSTLHSDTSRPFPKPASGRVAVKVINHLGDEVMKVFKV